MTVINTNIGSIIAARQAKTLVSRSENHQLRLSTGSRVNSASDDAAGLAVANKMNSELRGLKSALKNTADGVSLLQTAISGMQTSLNISQRLRELAVQSHNGVYTDRDRQNLQYEADSLVEELNKIATETRFNDVKLLDGSYDKFMRVGNTNPEVVRVTIDGMGINKNINEESFAFGNSTQILSPLEYATGNSNFSLKDISFAEGEMNPVYLNQTMGSGISQFDIPAISNGSTISSNPFIIEEAIATGTSNFDILSNSTANLISYAPEYLTSSNAEIRNGSISSTSVFTSTGFNNGDFSDGNATRDGNIVSIPGWDIHLENAFFDGRPFEIAGHQVPLDTQHGPSFTQEINHLETSIQNVNLNSLVQNGELTLDQGGGSSTPGFHVARGPYVVSQESVSLEVGDSVSFEWYGLGGGDAYDVYGYLVNEQTGATINLLNETGSTSGSSTQSLGLGNQGWITASSNITMDGNYKFVFVAGTFDRSGGYYSGNGLKIRNVDVNKLNPPPTTEFTAKVTVQAVEADQVNIDSSLLTSATTSVLNDPGGIFSILSDGLDFAKFSIDPNTGNIISTQPLRYSVQDTYQFTVNYTGPNGINHDEVVTLKLTPHDEGFTQVSAQESDEVLIPANSIPGYQSFIDFETNRGGGQVLTYELAAYSDNDGNPLNNGDPTDFQRFRIDPISGNIVSRSGLDFTNRQSYQFDIIARAADGRTHTNHVILNLTDTFNSTSNLILEETKQAIINIGDLSSTADFASRYAGIGSQYSIVNGLDSGLFDIVGNQIISNAPLLLNNRANYSFDLRYTQGVNTHTERVNINLTRYLQSDTVLTSAEANVIQLQNSIFSELDNFAASDGYRGTYRLEVYNNNDGDNTNDGDLDDFTQFSIDQQLGTITSNQPLDYSVENQFHFNKIYIASDGRRFTDRVILNLTDTLTSTANFSIEESNKLILNINDITSSSTYASRNPGGAFSLNDGSGLFAIIGNQIIASHEFRKEEKPFYTFELIYSHDDGFGNIINHTENITLSLTRFLQSNGEFIADEGREVILDSGEFIHLKSFVRDNPNGVFALTGTDASLFKIDNVGNIISRNSLDYDIKSQFDLGVSYTTSDGRIFTSNINLSLRDTLSAKSVLNLEETVQGIVPINILTSLQSHAAKDGNLGYFELLNKGDYAKFSIDADGTLRSKDELRMSEKSKLEVYVKYYGVTVGDLEEKIEINLTPTNYDHSESRYIASESSEIIIIPQLNPYIQSYAAADNYAGEWVVAHSPFDDGLDELMFNVDSKGKLNTTQMIDFETGENNFDIILYYYHSSGTKKYTDFVNLKITNDPRDDNNLALEGLDISTRENAAMAASHLEIVIDRINAAQAHLGAIQSRFSYNINNLSMAMFNTEQSKGRILDADFARESTELAKIQILSQAATDMLVRTNQSKQNLLILLN